MSRVLGLDVSTSITGMCFIDSSIPDDGKGSQIILLDYVDLRKCKDIWTKIDIVESVLNDLVYRRKLGKPDLFVLEEPLLGFSTGQSSASTIMTLLRFNGMVSYVGRKIFEENPTYVSAATARKTCGIKLQQRKKCGKSHKEQVFEHMINNDLRHVTWDRKKNGDFVDAAKDMTDAYVIARAATLMNK